MSDFFNRLDLLRKRRGESIIDIARMLAISGPAVHSWKKGGLPKPDKLRLLAAHYDTSVEWLLSGDDAVHETPSAPYSASPCPGCADRDTQIAELRTQIGMLIQTNAALAETHKKRAR